jgi:ribosomal protein S6--L-glutamate ligase
MNIAVLSRQAELYSTTRLVETAKYRGHNVEVINYVNTHMIIEPGKPEIFLGKQSLKNVNAVIPRIGSSKTFFGAAVVRQFEMNNIFCLNPSIAIVRARDKLRSLQILSRHGINIPKTAFACRPTEIDETIESVGGSPVVIKLLEGTQGIGVVLAETKKAAKSVIEAFFGLKVNILVQEFIKEAKAADIRTIVVGGEVVAAMKRQGLETDFRSNIHRGGLGMSIKLTEEEKQTAIAAANAMGLPLAGVDMLPSARGPLVIEVNSSPGLEGIEEASGIDVADRIIRFIEENAHIENVDSVGA